MPLPLLMLDVAGTTLTDEDRALLQHPATGGVILFSRNYDTPDQLRALVADMRAQKAELLVAVDHEGGRVQRFRDGFTPLPPMMSLAWLRATRPEAALDAAEQLGYLMAAELAPYDIDISFAPVLDIDVGTSSIIGDRSFGADAETVITLAGAFIRGMAAAGMAATGKHFPGHGFVQADSHLELPVDNRPLEALVASDLQPFIHLADDLKGIMPAHIRYAAVDAQPAGFSPFWLQGVLRQQLGFSGVIFSDDLSMEGATAAGSYADRARAALEAGCDMVLVCNNREGAKQVLGFLENYVTGLSPVPATLLSRQPVTLDQQRLAEARRWAAALGKDFSA